MKLILHKYQKTGIIKEAFNRKFNYLKMEFFNTRHKLNEASGLASLLSGNIELEKINPFIEEGLLSIRFRETVAEVESSLQNDFGIPVQIFRRHGNLWIETTTTDELTLMEQNEMGRKACMPVVSEKIVERSLENEQYYTLN